MWLVAPNINKLNRLHVIPVSMKYMHKVTIHDIIVENSSVLTGIGHLQPYDGRVSEGSEL